MKNLGDFERTPFIPVELDQSQEEVQEAPLDIPATLVENIEQESLSESIDKPNEISDGFMQKGKKAFEVVGEYGERVVDFLKYKSLKLKEYFGLISQEELDSLLLLDFEQELADNVPIDGEFSPEDGIKEIRSLPREQKRDAFEIFKSKTERQRQAWAMCRVFVERRIEVNHDVPKDVLMAEVERFGSRYGFGDQKQMAEELIDCYYVKRKKAQELRERYPDNTKLVSALTGEEFDKPQKFDVSLGPMSIDVEADSFDFKKIISADFSGRGSRIGGVAAVAKCDDSTYYTLLSRSSYSKIFRGSLSTVRKHEWEHHKNLIFRDFFEKEEISNDEANALIDEYELESDLKIKEAILVNVFNEALSNQLLYAKNELIARLVTENLKDVWEKLPRLFGDGRLYNIVDNIVNDESKKDDELWQKCARRILVINLRITIENAIRAFGWLVAKQDTFYKEIDGIRREFTTQEAIALLTDKPLEEWPKTVRRFRSQKKVDYLTAKDAE